MQDVAALNVSAAHGVAMQDFGLQHGHGTADYLLYADGRAAGVVEAKTEGHTLPLSYLPQALFGQDRNPAT